MTDRAEATQCPNIPEIPWEIILECILPHAPMTLGLANWELYVTKDKHVHWGFGASKKRIQVPGAEELIDCVNVNLHTYRKWAINSPFALSEGILIRPSGERLTPLTLNKKWILIPFLMPPPLIYPTRSEHSGWQLNSIYCTHTLRDARAIYWIDDWLIVRHFAPIDEVIQLFADDDWRAHRIVATKKISDDRWNLLADFDVGFKSSFMEYTNVKQDATEKTESVNVVRCEPSDTTQNRTKTVEFIRRYLAVDVLPYEDINVRGIDWRAGAILLNLQDRIATTIVHKVPSGYLELNPFP
jgi:hypothetical protein